MNIDIKVLWSVALAVISLTAWLVRMHTKNSEQHSDFKKGLDKIAEKMNDAVKNSNSRIDKVDQRIDKVDQRIDKVDQRIDKVEVKLDALTEEVRGIKTTLSILASKFNLHEKLIEKFVLSQSPLALTKEAIKLSKELNFKSMIERNWKKIHKLISENVQQKNPYNIQKYCTIIGMSNMAEILSNKDIEILKMKAYNEGIDVEPYGAILGIMIRDKYFEVENINTEEFTKQLLKN